MEFATVIGYTVVILMTAVGLSFVVFVHELGHFFVAKMCGVKCEKFYIGFDIGGYKICKFRWGETEYGIGILPLGGYVKMLGQEDNPSKMREEMERAKKAAEQQGKGEKGEEERPAASATGKEGSGNEDTRSTDQESSNSQPPASLYDPRSFLAQSVPKRMAIISAGVIMNIIFAFLMAFVAYMINIEEIPCTIGTVYPGKAGWQADLRPGDDILKIAGKDMHQFRDLQAEIQLGDAKEGDSVPVEVKRPGVEKPFTVNVKPNRDGGIPVLVIGVANGYTTQLAKDHKTWLIHKTNAVWPGSAAEKAEPPLKNGDRIVQIDDTPIDNYAHISTELARNVDKPIRLTVERDEFDSAGKPTGKTKRIVSVVPPNPMRDLGIVMMMGDVTAIQDGSPAAGAGIKPGDKIENPTDDPMRLPDWLRNKAGETVTLTVQHKDAETPVEIPVMLRQPTNFTPPVMESDPVTVSSLGAAYQILNRVQRIAEGSPADKAGLRPGDVITSAKLILPDDKTLDELQIDQSDEPLKFNEDKRNWAVLMRLLQLSVPGTKVEITFKRQDDQKEKTAVLEPFDSADWFNPDRGFRFEPYILNRKVKSVGEALSLGSEYTIFSLTTVLRTLDGLVHTQKVSPRGLSGPVTIIQVILRKADQGPSEFLLFLAFLSANLAVINFLPIPVLDGGHFVLLIYEGITGKPANETVQTVLAYIGLALILALMVWVFGLDLGLISRQS